MRIACNINKIQELFCALLTLPSIMTIMFATQPPRLVPLGVSRNLGGFFVSVN